MILVDFSPLLIAAAAVQKESIDEGLIRHISLNMIRSVNVKFKEEYGEIVICCDDKNTWRKNVFPYYKIRRSKTRSESTMDWTAIHKYKHMMEDELEEYFPYRVINVPNCEADDIIGVLVRERPPSVSGMFGGFEPTLIYSNDEDFIQLQVYDNVRQYFRNKQRVIRHPNPKDFLLEHIIDGDSIDDIPNILNPDNAIADKLSKKKMTTNRMNELKSKYKDSLIDGCETTEEDLRYYRNKVLIDLNHTPIELQRQIVAVYVNQMGKDRKKMKEYFMKKRLKDLYGSIGEF